jgi:hypothetical protein
VVGAIEADDTTIAVRLGTALGDPVTAKIQDHLADKDSSVTVPGQLLADALAASLATVLADGLPGDVTVDEGAVGQWWPLTHRPHRWGDASALRAGPGLSQARRHSGVPPADHCAA